jgi:hypothetical protein
MKLENPETFVWFSENSLRQGGLETPETCDKKYVITIFYHDSCPTTSKG